MSEKINGQTGFIPGTQQTVDPDERPDRAEKGYTGVDPIYYGAADKTYAPLGKQKLADDAVKSTAEEVAAESKDDDKADEDAKAEGDAPKAPSSPSK